MVNVTLPVLNEEGCLKQNVSKISKFLLSCNWPGSEIVIADNGSSDSTSHIGLQLAKNLPNVKYLRLNERGRGRALKAAWSASGAQVVTYMDIDLSTKLEHLPEIVNPILSGKVDFVTGSRLLIDSRIQRSLRREILSQGYSILVQTVGKVRMKDYQCGFKACSKSAVVSLLPKIKNNNWFFDTELLLKAHWNGFKVLETPIEWMEDPDSRVKIIPTVVENLKELRRLWLENHKEGNLFQ